VTVAKASERTPVSRTDPRVQAAARALETTMIQHAWEEDGTLFIQDPYETYEVVSSGYTNTPPKAREDVAATAVQAPSPESSGLDDFTAIAGVGSVTAQKLHDLDLYTYDDLRAWLANGTPDAEDYEISDHTVGQIEAWLSQRLV
jgi:predicted flap endonuclease-1-like 5' DNA nuclease